MKGSFFLYHQFRNGRQVITEPLKLVAALAIAATGGAALAPAREHSDATQLIRRLISC